MFLKFTHILNKLELVENKLRQTSPKVLHDSFLQIPQKKKTLLYDSVHSGGKKSIVIHIPTYDGLHQTIEKYYAHNQHWEYQRMRLC